MYECLIYMLTYLHHYENPTENYQSFTEITKEDGNENEALYYMLKGSSSAVFNLCSNISKYETYCPECGTKKRKYEFDFGIKLHLSPPSMSVADEIERQQSYLSFTAFRCMKCGKGLERTTYSVVSYPPILLIYWQYQGEDSPKYGRTLNVGGCVYTLCGVCCHSGSRECGHFYSVVRNSVGGYDIVDDDYVEKTERVYRQNAIALLYTDDALIGDGVDGCFSLARRLGLRFV